jgi:hypothetical protein
VLVDADETSWPSWNTYAEKFVADTGATRIPIDDGGITGPAFFDHVRRLRRPLVNSPKGQTTPIPPDLVQRPIIAPAPYWTWSLVWRWPSAVAWYPTSRAPARWPLPRQRPHGTAQVPAAVPLTDANAGSGATTGQVIP